jgi:ubiquinone biosynthesis protein COQ4
MVSPAAGTGVEYPVRPLLEEEMSADASQPALPRLAPPPPRRRVEWARAWRALRTLTADPERTDQVFELINALSGNAGERLFQRFCADPDGRRLLAKRPSLIETLADLDTLAALPEGSFGRTYADFMRRERIEAKGLVDAAQAVAESRALDPERDWFFQRLRDQHDLWHVLTGYGRDIAGEAANLAFSYAQTRNRGIGVIVLAAAVLGPKRLDFFWPRYLWRAWRRGRRTLPLPMAAYEELLALPLVEVRERLRIEPPERAHPGGVIVFQPQAQGASS